MIRYRHLTKEQRDLICNVVYMLVSPSGRFYIGQTGDFERRLREYRYCHCGHQKRLQYSIRKYGFDDFEIFILEECKSEKDLDIVETKWISYWNSTSKEGLNSMSGGGSLKRHSIESIQKMRVAKIGPLNSMWKGTHTPEARKKISLANTGLKRNQKEISRLRNLHLGKPKTIEHRLKIASSKCMYSYHIISPTGGNYTVNNLSIFCKERGLSKWKLGEVARGNRKANRDWDVKRTPLCLNI